MYKLKNSFQNTTTAGIMMTIAAQQNGIPTSIDSTASEKTGKFVSTYLSSVLQGKCLNTLLVQVYILKTVVNVIK